MAGYPNYFMLVGPNTATGHTSVLLYAEAQIDYIIQCLRHLERNGMSSLDVLPGCKPASTTVCGRSSKGTIWTAGGCHSWYLDADGGTSALWPGYTWQFRRALRRFDARDYSVRAGPRQAVA